jgi:hypothetical protein
MRMTALLKPATGAAAAAAKATWRLLARIGPANMVFAASLLALGLAAWAWPWVVLEVAAWTAGFLLLFGLVFA